MKYELFSIDSPKFDSANCATIGDPDIFFPETTKDKRENLALAKRVCGNCFHRVECLEYAVDNFIPHGIWGGLTERERLKLIPRKPNGKVINQGQRAYNFHVRGLSIEEIMGKLRITRTQVEKAIIRYSQERRPS